MRGGARLRHFGGCAALTLCTLLLDGCHSLSGYAGAAGGVVAGGASANPAVGIGVGIAVQAATQSLFDLVFRNMQRKEQDRIAAQAAAMPIGTVAHWQVKQVIPFQGEQGDMQVVEDLDNALSHCRMVLFSVTTKKQRAAMADKASAAVPPVQWFQTPVCQRSDGVWKWAQAEPATDRWGTLQ